MPTGRLSMSSAVPVFRRLGDAELAALADSFEESRHTAGDTISEESATDRSLTVVADATVELPLSGPFKGRRGPQSPAPPLGAFRGSLRKPDAQPDGRGASHRTCPGSAKR